MVDSARPEVTASLAKPIALLAADQDELVCITGLRALFRSTRSPSPEVDKHVHTLMASKSYRMRLCLLQELGCILESVSLATLPLLFKVVDSAFNEAEPEVTF